MSEELDSQLSAMFDGELPAAECELLARRLARDEQLKARWGRYAVIAATIRSERGVRLDNLVARRVSAALTGEPELEQSPGGSRPVSRRQWRQPLAAVALAAGVAAIAIFWVRSDQHGRVQTAPVTGTAGPPAPTAPLTALNTAAPARRQGSPTYVVPRALERRAIDAPNMSFANYVVAHSEFSSPVARRALLSSLVASESASAAQPPPEESSPPEDVQEHAQSRP